MCSSSSFSKLFLRVCQHWTAGLGRRNTFEFDGMQNKYKKQKSLPSNWDLNQILFRNAFLVGTRTIQRQFQRTTRINGWVSFFFPFSFFTDKATRRIICREHLLPKETRERGGRRSGAASIYITVVNYTGSSFFSSFYLLEREIERAMLSRRVDVTCVRNHVKVVRFFSRLVGLRSPRARQA